MQKALKFVELDIPENSIKWSKVLKYLFELVLNQMGTKSRYARKMALMIQLNHKW